MPDPVDKGEDLVRETAQGRSDRAPFMALGGVVTIIAVVAGAVIAVMLALYFLL